MGDFVRGSARGLNRDGQGIGINGEGSIPPGIKRDRDYISRDRGMALSLVIPPSYPFLSLRATKTVLMMLADE